MIDESGEMPHEVDRGDERWQENYYFFGWDDDHRFGFTVHGGHIASRGETEIKSVLTLDGRTVSSFRTHLGDSIYDLPGFQVDIRKPYRHLQIRLDETGYPSAAGEWLCERASDEVHFGFELDVTSTLAPHDWTSIAGRWGMPDVVADHYELGCAFTGSAHIGGESVQVSGLMARDHSWGPRQLHKMDMCIWTPMAFPDAYISGATFLIGGKYVGILAVDTGHGPQIRSQPWVRLDGLPDAYQYGSASILFPADDTGEVGGGAVEMARIDCRALLPVRYPSAGRDFYWTDGLGVATWNGRRGFGNVEVSRCLPSVMAWPDLPGARE